MNPFINSSPNHIKGALVQQGMSVYAFAKREGFTPITVYKTIHRYAGQNRQPCGRITERILKRLNFFLSQEVNN